MKVVLVGGFLGSGKTTAIQEASTILLEQGTKVGVITNDQGSQLVDHRFISNFGIPSMEVINGCFCCNFEQLMDNVQSMTQTNFTEVVFAESVGSCTDLVATVVRPFLQIHPDTEIVVSVFVDARVLPTIIKGSRLFADSVNYIYRKQIEEADVLVVNKVDLLDAEQLKELMQVVTKQYPSKEVIYQNSLDHQNIEQWLKVLNGFNSKVHKESLELDYDLYGSGEAELGWLDQEVVICTLDNTGVEASTRLINKIYSKISHLQLPVGHLKFLLNNGKQQHKISFTSMEHSDSIVQLEIEKSNQVTLLINARVQADPEILKKAIADALSELVSRGNCKVIENFASAFQPGYPRPTHRL